MRPDQPLRWLQRGADPAVAAPLVKLPITIATGPEVGISLLPLIIATMMAMGPSGYQFGEYWEFGLPELLWWLVVALVIAPLYWSFLASIGDSVMGVLAEPPMRPRRYLGRGSASWMR